jgi:hypothetical protein
MVSSLWVFLNAVGDLPQAYVMLPLGPRICDRARFEHLPSMCVAQGATEAIETHPSGISPAVAETAWSTAESCMMPAHPGSRAVRQRKQKRVRMSLAFDARNAEPASRLLLLLEGRALHELAAFLAYKPLLSLAPRGDGHPVLVMPGLVASDVSTRPLRGFLREHGYAAHGWNLGTNRGYYRGLEQDILHRVRDLRRRHGRKVSLLEWSLGGIFARQIAKIIPGDIRAVITLGSPFGGNPRATHAWRLYELLSGHRVEDGTVSFARSLADPPPVPTTAIYSRGDGICAWQCCVEKRTATTESIEVHGSHCGLGHNPAAVYAVADRLAQSEGQWRPFDRAGWRWFVYPEPAG